MIIKDSNHVTITEFYREFLFVENGKTLGSGYSFKCNSYGRAISPSHQVLIEEMARTGLDSNDRMVTDRGTQRYERSFVEPAVFKCDCGEEFELVGDTRCSCGQWYNSYGQKLMRDPKYWE